MAKAGNNGKWKKSIKSPHEFTASIVSTNRWRLNYDNRYARFFSFIYRHNLDGHGEAKQACIYNSFSFKTFKDTKECHNRLRINIRMAFFKYFTFWKNYWICCSCHFGYIRCLLWVLLQFQPLMKCNLNENITRSSWLHRW